MGHLDKYADAEALFRLALQGREKALGANHVDVLTTVNHMACLLKQQGRIKDAEVNFERALAGLAIALGPNHLLTAETAYNYAVLRVQQGKRKSASRLFAQAQRGLAENLGPEHQHTLDALYWEIKCVKEEDGTISTASSGNSEEKLFVSRNTWKQSDQCELCEMHFTMVKRQHHCRVCSRSVCNECSLHNTMVLEYDSTKPVRCCSVCAQQGF